MFFDMFLPMLAVSSYVFVYRAIGAPEAYVGFVVIGGAMTAFWMNIMWSMSSQLYWEKEQGNLALYIMAPNSMMAVLLGMAVGGMFATFLRAIAIIALGTWFFHVTYAITSFWQLIAIFFTAMTALYGMGMMSASLFLLLSREADHLAQLATEPVFLRFRLLLPDQIAQLLGGSRGFDYPADPRAGCHAATDFLHRRHARLPRYAAGAGYSPGAYASSFCRGARPARLHGAARHPGRPPDRKQTLERSNAGDRHV